MLLIRLALAASCAAIVCLGLMGCGGGAAEPGAGAAADGGASVVRDGGSADGGAADGGSGSGGNADAGAPDAGAPDAGPLVPWVVPADVGWAPCPDGGALEGLECASLEVPLNHEAPRERIRLALSRARATSPDNRKGILLVNPGGPGGPSRPFVASVRDALHDAAARFDIVGVDWRGVGGSEPVIDCLTDAQRARRRSLDVFRDRAEVLALEAACRDSLRRSTSAEVLRHVSTQDHAKDLDLVRQALGEQKLNYLGVSYGTRLGAVYMKLFRTKVGAFVLDSPSSPNPNVTEVLTQRAQAAEQGLELFFSDCARLQCSFAGAAGVDAVRAAFDALFQRALNQGLPAPSGRLARGDDIISTVFGLYTANGLTSVLSHVLTLAQDGDATELLNYADLITDFDPETGTFTNDNEAGTAIACRDRMGAPSVSDADSDAILAATAQYVRFGRYDAYGTSDCRDWPVESVPAFDYAMPSTPRAFLIIGEKDAVTPPAWGRDLQARMQNSSYLFQVPGPGHGRYDYAAVTPRIQDFFFNQLREPSPFTCATRPSIGAMRELRLTVFAGAGLPSDGSAKAELLSTEDDSILASAAFGTAAFVVLTVQTGTRPVPGYVRVSAPGFPTGETWFSRPLTESQLVIPLASTTSAQNLLTPLGLTYDAQKAFARVTAFSCIANQIVINSAYSIEPPTEGTSIYNGQGTTTACVPSPTATTSNCGGGVVPNATPGTYTIRYSLGGGSESATVRLRAGVLTDVRVTP